MASRKLRILVVGSVNMDLVLQAERAPAAGETLFGEQYSTVPGGKGANQAIAAARLGAHVTFVGRVGDDANGARLREALAAEGIETELLKTDPDSQSGLAVIVVEASGENRIIVFSGANMRITEQDAALAFERDYDAVLMNLEIPGSLIVGVCRMAREREIPVMLDAGPAQPFDLARTPGLEILSPNESEAQALTGRSCATPDEAREAAAALADLSGARHVVVKLGAQGALYHTDGQADWVPPFEVNAVDTTAAGDAFTAALTLRYLQDGDIAAAVRYANAAGALACTRLGAQPSLPAADAVARFINGRG
jgi:ribokinase